MSDVIELVIDEQNELLFKVQVEGTSSEPGSVSARLVCECDDVSYMFTAKKTDDRDVVQFTLPSMKGKINEGKYNARIEVLVGNRHFTPVSFDVSFKQPMTVVAESVTPMKKTQQQKQITVSASPIVAQKKRIEQNIVQQKPVVENKVRDLVDEDDILRAAEAFVRCTRR